MKFIRSYSVDFKRHVLVRNMLFSFAIAIITLFIGLTVNFFLIYAMPGDPVHSLLPHSYTHEQYIQMRHLLGFDQPMIVQYFRYLSDMFTGKWGYSSSLYRGMPVGDLIGPRFLRMIEILLLPTILGLVIGIILAKISMISKRKWVGKVIQGYNVIFIAIPIFSLGMVFQYFAYQGTLLPSMGYKTSTYPTPPLKTGFLILDALLDGKLWLANDIAKHFILPVLALIIIIIPLITMQTRSAMEKKQHEKSVISNTTITALTLGLIFTFYILIDLTFWLQGLSNPFLYALQELDFFLLRGIIFLIICLLVVITFISNVVFSVFKSLTFTRQDSIENNPTPPRKTDINQIEKNPGTESKRDLKKYLRYIYKSPFILIGLIVVIGIIIVASFPELISGYSLNETLDFYPNSVHPTQNPYMPPSPENPLGTTTEGRDLFAVVLWGTQHALRIGLLAILIGILGGALFGFISSIHRHVNRAIEAILIITCIIPGTILILMTVSYFGHRFEHFIYPIGVLLIPIFTRIIANPPLEKRNIIISLKKLLIYIPLVLGFVILVYQTFSFLGFYDLRVVDLGYYISQAQAQIPTAPWAFLWPGAFIYFMVFGFIILHMGLKNTFLDRLNSSNAGTYDIISSHLNR